jgi:hypothetical protein
MDIENMTNCKVKAKIKRVRDDIFIESMRFDKNSKIRLQNILHTKSLNISNMVLRISCLFVDHENYEKIRSFGKYSGHFYSDVRGSFKVHDFDIYYKPRNVAEYDDHVEISDVSMIIYKI